MLTVILAMWVVRAESRRGVRRLGITALAVVIAQGILGGLTVKLMLPPSISIAHASLAEAFFCITVALAFVTSGKWTQSTPAREIPNAGLIQKIALTSTIAVYVQIILGATIRHAELGVVAHIIGAIAVLGCAMASVLVILLAGRQKVFLQHAMVMLALVAMQIGLGLATLIVRIPKNVEGQLSAVQVLLPTVHLALGALILATSLGMTLKTYRFLAATREEPVLPFAHGALS
jgi:cytochrome c oxidase assembly protein subunit 15